MAPTPRSAHVLAKAVLTRLAAIVIVSVVSVVAVGAVAGAAPAAASGAFSAESEQQFVDAVNRERAAHGLGTLAVHSELTDVARGWAEHLEAEGRLSHNPDLGNQVTADWEKLAENVGTGWEIDSIHRAFMDSPSHRANILDGDLTHIGLGVVNAGGQLWVTQNFMRLAAAPTGAPAPAPSPEPAPQPAPEPAPQPAPAPASAPAAAPEPVSRAVAPAAPAPEPEPEQTPASAVVPTVEDVVEAQPALGSWRWSTAASSGVSALPASQTATTSVSSGTPILPVGVVAVLALSTVTAVAAVEVRRTQPLLASVLQSTRATA